MKKVLSSIFTLVLMYLFFRYLIFLFLIWAIIEVIIKALKERKPKKVIIFICNFVTIVLVSVNYVMNILLCVPANRIIITPQGDKFGNPTKNFTETLRLNIVKGTIKPRGLLLHKIFESIRNFGKHE